MLIRRYRLFTLCAAVMLFMIYHLSQSNWDGPRQYGPSKNLYSQNGNSPWAADHRDGDKVPLGQDLEAIQVHKDDAPTVSRPESDKASKHVQNAQAGGSHRDETKTVPSEPTKGSQDGHDGDRPKTIGGEDENLVNVHWKNPPNVPLEDPADDAIFKVHWKPGSEHFPVSPDSMRSLPLDKSPRKMPKIQAAFEEPEPAKSKSRRIERRDRVKKEIKRAWSGYRKHAWLHDELLPVSAKYRDPFCRWSATLIDSLDTLWLAGLHDEFDEAARAVQHIDFSYTPRGSIPVFETTIRYLGGVLGAVDVSGGSEGDYAFLVDKAVELADLLLSVFDTPNRMPILQYRWKPQYASQPHRAGVVSIAELGTLSMEFTRLAQMTKKMKYYDAVDRITDALVAMQEAGTVVPGLFPESLDASGCNRSATAIRHSLSQAAQAQLDSADISERPDGYVVNQVPQGKQGTGPTRGSRPENDGPSADGGSRKGVEHGRDAVRPLSKRQGPAGNHAPPHASPANTGGGRQAPFGADGTGLEWDCVPQGLEPSSHGYQSFHMGGGQDSAYEYLQKQYILLGGLEDKYKNLHLDSIHAIDKWLLYRPMIKDDRDILFPARLVTQGKPDKDARATYEITHLACFLGGMYAMSGKLFDREKDIETAARLTDGCIWAYGATPSGIMPETAQVVACPTLERCEFNETLWRQRLDPAWESRDQKAAEWDEEWGDDERLQSSQQEQVMSKQDEAAESLRLAAQQKQNAKSSPEKRAAVPVLGKSPDAVAGSELPQALKDRIGWKPQGQEGSQSEDDLVKKPPPLNSVLEANRQSLEHHQGPATVPKLIPQRMQTHQEFVNEMIDRAKLPPGFVSIDSAAYVLRPEAIESVFYMYRVTGDAIWQEKGWDMFEATVRATRTEIANSAIENVFDEEPKLTDEMESFWLAETLKYYYLLFSDADVASLDEWVFNTEAHPFKRPL